MQNSGNEQRTRSIQTRNSNRPTERRRVLVEYYIPPPPPQNYCLESSDSDDSYTGRGIEIGGIGKGVNILDFSTELLERDRKEQIAQRKGRKGRKVINMNSLFSSMDDGEEDAEITSSTGIQNELQQDSENVSHLQELPPSQPTKKEEELKISESSGTKNDHVNAISTEVKLPVNDEFSDSYLIAIPSGEEQEPRYAPSESSSTAAMHPPSPFYREKGASGMTDEINLPSSHDSASMNIFSPDVSDDIYNLQLDYQPIKQTEITGMEEPLKQPENSEKREDLGSYEDYSLDLTALEDGQSDSPPPHRSHSPHRKVRTPITNELSDDGEDGDEGNGGDVMAVRGEGKQEEDMNDDDDESYQHHQHQHSRSSSNSNRRHHHRNHHQYYSAEGALSPRHPEEHSSSHSSKKTNTSPKSDGNARSPRSPLHSQTHSHSPAPLSPKPRRPSHSPHSAYRDHSPSTFFERVISPHAMDEYEQSKEKEYYTNIDDGDDRDRDSSDDGTANGNANHNHGGSIAPSPPRHSSPYDKSPSSSSVELVHNIAAMIAGGKSPRNRSPVHHSPTVHSNADSLQLPSFEDLPEVLVTRDNCDYSLKEDDHDHHRQTEEQDTDVMKNREAEGAEHLLAKQDSQTFDHSQRKDEEKVQFDRILSPKSHGVHEQYSHGHGNEEGEEEEAIGVVIPFYDTSLMENDHSGSGSSSLGSVHSGFMDDEDMNDDDNAELRRNQLGVRPSSSQRMGILQSSEGVDIPVNAVAYRSRRMSIPEIALLTEHSGTSHRRSEGRMGR